MKKQELLAEAITNLFLKIDDKKKLLSVSERKEHEENVSDYDEMIDEMYEIIRKAYEVIDDEKAMRGELIELRVKMLNIIWHYEQLIEVCMKLLYGEKESSKEMD